MGTHSITLVRDRSVKKRNKTNVLGGPVNSSYFYKYYVCIYQHYDGYVEGGVGEWLANSLCVITRDLMNKNPLLFVDAGLIGSKLVQAFFNMSELQNPRLIPMASLDDIFSEDFSYAYIVTFDAERGFDDQSIMLSVFQDKDFILTARPEKFLEKYRYYIAQMDEMKKSFAEINYGDDEVEKEGYLLEDKLLIEFLKEKIHY